MWCFVLCSLGYLTHYPCTLHIMGLAQVFLCRGRRVKRLNHAENVRLLRLDKAYTFHKCRSAKIVLTHTSQKTADNPRSAPSTRRACPGPPTCPQAHLSVLTYSLASSACDKRASFLWAMASLISGKTPSCCHTHSRSKMSQTSAILPSSTRKMLMPELVTCLPVEDLETHPRACRDWTSAP
jgi:hypothetical protein